jgi:membrane-associated protease RseP (regulator of RpoE activity)
MDDSDPPADGPPVEELAPLFHVFDTEVEGDRLLYYGEPRVGRETFERRAWSLFREYGFEVRLTTRSETDPITGVDLAGTRQVLVAKPRSVGVDGVPWTNVAFALLTVLSTLFAGTQWYYVPIEGPLDLLAGWPFALAVLSVLGVHELGHYAASRLYGVEASLPYFIPLPNVIGTMGAVIRMRGRMPDRKALFDIGVAGPLAGLAATVVVTVIGLSLDPIAVPERALSSSAVAIEFNDPPLLQLIAELTGQPLGYDDPTKQVNPVVFAGWVGMFVTFLNLIPVGQLDGGHLVRAMLGERQATLAAAVPGLLFALAGYLYYVREVAFNAVFLWVFWGLFTMGIAYAGPATPVRDDALDAKRIAVGLLTFGLGLLCFTPIPFEIVP